MTGNPTPDLSTETRAAPIRSDLRATTNAWRQIARWVGHFASCGLYVAWIEVLLFLLAVPVTAQTTSGFWSGPELVFQTDGAIAVSSMALVSDGWGNLHWIFGHSPEEGAPAGIDYLRWNGELWSDPVNIILNRDGSGVGHIRAAIDSQQNLHLLWGGGGNALYYASAVADMAGSPRAWSVPVNLIAAIGEADIVVSPDDLVYVVYVDPASASIGMLISLDRGETWSVPFSVAASNISSIPSAVRLAIDGVGRLHVAWTEVLMPGGWPPMGAFYARSLDGGLSWTPPLQVADAYHGQIGVAAVGNDQVHLVWRSTIGGDGTFHQWSADGGNTWASPDRHEDRGGFSGLPAFAVDSAGTLHYVIGSAFTTFWRNGVLAPYTDVAGPELRTGVNQSPGWTHPERAAIAITTGNRLHVVFETGFKELWHTTVFVDAPELPPPTPTPVVIPPPGPTITPSISEQDHGSTPVPGFFGEQLSPTTSTAALAPFLGVGVVALLVAVLVIIKTRRPV